MHNNRKLRSCCSTSRSAADRQTTGLNKREVISHVRTRSLDRSSPRVGRADNRGSAVNHAVQTDMKNLQDYLPRKSKKKTQTQVSESPLHSPETLNALENAEKLIKEAQKRILEASYDVHSSPERDSSARSAEIKTKDDESLYIRDVVATRFHEANESGRIFTRIGARRPTEKPHKPVDVRPRWPRKIVGKNSTLDEKERISRRVMIKNNKSTIPANDNKMPQNISSLDKKTSKDENRQQVPEKETSKSDILEKCINSNKPEYQTVSKTFKVQEGPHVDIRNELTITSVEKIDISPWPPSFSVQHNIKTYEFRHDEPHVAERDNEIKINAESRDKPEVNEKSCSITNKNPAAVPSSQRGSSLDLVENKSGRSIESEPPEGHEDTRTSCRDVQNNDKPDNPAESFIDFLQRTGNQQNLLTNDRDDYSSEDLDAKNKIEILDRAVRQFFQNFKRGNEARNHCEPELDCPDGESPINPTEFDKSDVSVQSDIRHKNSGGGKYFEDNWSLNEIDLETPNFGELDNVLKKFDGSMNKVLRDTRNLELLISEYSMEENICNRSKCNSIIVDTGAIGQRKIHPTKDIDSKNERIQENPTRDLPKHDNLDNSDLTNEDKDSESSREFSQAFSRLSQRENPETDSLWKKISGRKILPHPRYSTPLNNDLKIGKSFGNNTNCTPNDFANFFNGIHRSKIEHDKKSSRSREISKIDQINDDKIMIAAEHTPIPSVGTKNNLETNKKTILNEIEKNCNFQSFFNRERSTQNENTEIHDIVTLPTCSAHDNPHSPTTSLARKSITEKISTQDQNSMGTKIIDEVLTKKNSSKSECSPARKITELSKNQSVHVEKTETARTNTLSGTKNSMHSESVGKSKNSANLSFVPNPENIIQTTVNKAIESLAKNASGEEEKTENISASIEKINLSAQEKEPKNINSATSSSTGSSIRDRTSFDISTAYSEDFEEPSESSKKLNIQEKSNSPKNPPLGSVPTEPEVTTKAEMDSNEADGTVEKLSHSSLAVHTNSKTEITPEKSIPPSMRKSNDRGEHDKIDGAETSLGKQDVEEKVADKNRMDKSERNMSKIEENPNKGSDSSSPSMKSSKISRTSSLNEESCQDAMGTPEILDLKPNSIASPSRSPCKGMIFLCDCKQCKLRIRAKENFEKSHNNTIETIFEESFDEEKLVKSSMGEKMELPFPKIAEKSNEPRIQSQEMKHSIETEETFSKSLANREREQVYMGIKSKLEEIVNFGNSLFIHSTPKKSVKDSTCPSEISDYIAPDPIASDAHSSRAIATGEENYSEGELYLPSSCSYSLGEIRISELGTCTTSGLGAESSRRNADTMRIFVSRSLINTDSTDNTTHAINSLGEVLATEIELTSSN